MNDTELTEDERDWLADVWDEETTVSVGPFYPVVASIVAARVAAAHADALEEAADALEGRLGTDGAPKSLWEFRAWLRDRAAVADPEPPAPWCPECGPTCPLHGEPQNTCPSCALGQHRCTRDLAPCDCQECA